MPGNERCDSLVKEWLSEYKTLSEAELHSYASTVRHSEDLINALYATLQREETQQVLDPVCHQLFEFYRSTEIELRRFAVELVPTLILTYLQAVSVNRKKWCGGMETLLLGIYNLEVVNDDGSPKVKTFTIPSLSRPSVYHEPSSQLALIESSLSQPGQDQHQLVTWGPFPNVERLHAHNRLNVLTYVLYIYNSQIKQLSLHSQKSLCDSFVALCQTGFEALFKIDDCMDEELKPRISLSSGLLLEALNGIYHVMYNSYPGPGQQAVEAIGKRAQYELYNDVMMVCNAIQSSLNIASLDGEDLGLLSTSTSKPTFSKAALTNASFKTKKLPDDIPVPSDDEEVMSQNAVGGQDGAEGSDAPPQTRTDRRMSDTERGLISDKMRMAIKSALKKTEGRMKKEAKMKVTLHTATNGNEADGGERRMSGGHLGSQKSDGVELKSYQTEHNKWSSLDEEPSGSELDDRDRVSFSTNRRPVPTINTEV